MTATLSPPTMAGGFLTRPAVAPRVESGRIVNAMTVDVEDYFQVQAFADIIRPEQWEHWPQRVEANTDRLLQMFAASGVKATFFTLGWVGKRFPALIRRIVDDGHELASHGWNHRRVFEQNPGDFRTDVRSTKLLLEDIGGVAVLGYRAATFSITRDTLWAYDVLAEEGHAYSSSIYPVHHDLYGMPDAPRGPFLPRPHLPIEEYPLSTIHLAGRNLPCSGGGYFRLLPYATFRRTLRHLNDAEAMSAIFYFHPWEIDPGQPRVYGIPARSRFRHYFNLSCTGGRLRRLLADFAWDRLDRVFLRRP